MIFPVKIQFKMDELNDAMIVDELNDAMIVYEKQQSQARVMQPQPPKSQPHQMTRINKSWFNRMTDFWYFFKYDEVQDHDTGDRQCKTPMNINLREPTVPSPPIKKKKKTTSLKENDTMIISEEHQQVQAQVTPPNHPIPQPQLKPIIVKKCCKDFLKWFYILICDFTMFTFQTVIYDLLSSQRYGIVNFLASSIIGFLIVAMIVMRIFSCLRQ